MSVLASLNLMHLLDFTAQHLGIAIFCQGPLFSLRISPSFRPSGCVALSPIGLYIFGSGFFYFLCGFTCFFVLFGGHSTIFPRPSLCGRALRISLLPGRRNRCLSTICSHFLVHRSCTGVSDARIDFSTIAVPLRTSYFFLFLFFCCGNTPGIPFLPLHP